MSTPRAKDSDPRSGARGRRGPTRAAARWVDSSVGGTRTIREELRHIFPDHWSFFLGEIALYSFIILVVTGVFLALFFHASAAEVVYDGSYEPLQGVHMSDAYSSTVQLSFDVRAGLLMRQIHHWSALIFAAAIVVHLFRMFFTGAYRRPRRINWLIGLSLLLLVLGNGVFGYSLPDDLLSGIGLRIAYSITESIPFLGPWLASVLFGGEFPTSGLIARIYPVHIFLLPALIAGLLAAHLGILWFQRHTEYPGPGKDDRTIVGTPLVPAYALRTTGYFLLIFGVTAFMGGFLQINPVWLFGPYDAAHATTMAQPDWYTTWLEGGLRMFPGWDLQVGGFLLPALFWPAVVFPGILFTFLFLWPWIDALITRDNRVHNVLTLPDERPGRLAFGAGLCVALLMLLIAGGNDVFAVVLGVEQPTVIQVLLGQAVALPLVVGLFAWVVFRRGPEEPRPARPSRWRLAVAPGTLAALLAFVLLVGQGGDNVGTGIGSAAPMPTMSPTTAGSPSASPTGSPSASPTGSPSPSATGGEQFAATWEQLCTGCHGAQGEGGVGPDLRPLSTADLDRIATQITNGGGGMPAFGDQLTEDQISGLSEYVAALE